MRSIRDFDWLYFGTMLALTGVGIVFIWSATHWSATNLAGTQLRWLGVSLVVMLALLAFDYQRLAGVAYAAYAVALVALVLVLVPGIGVVRNDARRWIELPGFLAQPSEFTKIVVVLALARYLMYRKTRRAVDLIVPLLIVLVPMGLILIEPDLGTSLVFLPALLSMLYVSGASRKHLAALIGAGAVIAPILYFFVLGPKQQGRITAFLWPELDPSGAGWHLRQSLAAVASGGVSGEGFSSGSPIVLNRGFAAHTDFIFALISHEWGFLGALAVLLLALLFFSRGLEIAGATREPFGRLVVVGYLSMLAFQTLINIGMTLRLCPITGITLPYVSYGGSSLLVCFIMSAVVLNVGLRRKAVLAPEDFR